VKELKALKLQNFRSGTLKPKNAGGYSNPKKLFTPSRQDEAFLFIWEISPGVYRVSELFARNISIFPFPSVEKSGEYPRLNLLCFPHDLE
jgi:hypothetical protein